LKLRCRDALVALDRAALMGVVNVTPDSFSDGGLWFDASAAIARGIDMVVEGAAFLDVGGESTRPGAAPVSEDEELRRVLPVVEGLRAAVDVPISIDTRKAGVARRAVSAGASMVNDTIGEPTDRSLDAVAAESGAAVVVMHSRGTPATMRELTQYDDVTHAVAAWLERRIEELVSAGVGADAIVVDPGFGFAKTPGQNLELLRRLDEIVAIGHPVLVGTSRKSFIGEVLDAPVDERLEGTAATVAWAVAHGADIVRVHDVRAMERVVRMTEAIRDPSPEFV
jgi:dihydropteroate synthase